MELIMGIFLLIIILVAIRYLIKNESDQQSENNNKNGNIFCKDCKHFIDNNGRNTFTLCQKGLLIIKDPITGKHEYKLITDQLCIFKNKNCDCIDYEEKSLQVDKIVDNSKIVKLYH